jgi:hypothetical protein
MAGLAAATAELADEDGESEEETDGEEAAEDEEDASERA